MQTYFNPATQRHKSLWQTYRTLFQAAGQQRGRFLHSLCCAIGSAMCFGTAIALLYPLLYALDSDSTAQSAVIFYGVFCALLLCLGIGLRIRAEYYDTKGYSQLATYQLRRLLGEKLRRVPLAVLSGFRAGELSAVAVQSVNEATNYAFSLISILIYGIVTPIAAALCLCVFDLRFGLLIFIIFPVIAPLYLWRRKAFRRGFSLLAEAQQRLKGETIEFIQGMEILKSTAQTENKQHIFNRVIEDVANIQRIGTQKGERPNLIITSSIQFSLIAVLLIGTIWVISGSAHWTLLATVLILLARIADVLNFFVQMSSLLEIFAISCEKFHSLMALPEFPSQQLERLPTDYTIRYEKVRFGYTEQKTVLHDIHLSLRPNSLNAFVGTSGCGKTTLLLLLLRYADPQQGRISIGGVDIRKFSQAQLMSLISVVFQEVYLFQDSVLNNIRMAKPDATDDEVIRACRLAQCHDFIQALPNGYDTLVNDIGSNFSGGEKQRLAIARAILKDAPILILDEPTASLDTYNELAVQKALDRLVKNRTVLIIAHRLSTIVGADCIHVLENGNIIEQGTHQALLDLKGRYAEFWQYQQDGNKL
ncbi:ABC transporter ATP-binding protein [Aggregatibacter kilianii]|uniref:ABC transporter ATP-binding protein n=1 Tax=Aggregatibacter kilianii TaxID=2025884 RepID=UPI000D6502B8|nr:ABC transporter ATP-binding protein [Aggregatibacter kilianii]